MSAVSKAYGVDYHLVKAVEAAKSVFNSKAVSPKGAVGLMRLMPGMTRRYGVLADRGSSGPAKLTDPDLKIQTGTRFLAGFGRQIELALAAYHAGEGAVARTVNQISNYKETRLYVKKVMSVYRKLQTKAS